ncbi:MAG: MFS transporter [Methanothrix sp.]|nr:MFS transporter [Methanothrix sp.]
MTQKKETAINLNVFQNINLNYLYAGLMRLRLDWAVWMLFLGQRDIGLFEIGLIQSISQFASMASDAPAGAISDILGRKTSAVLSIVIRVIGFAIILVAHDVMLFALGYALVAVSQEFFNATYESIAYDSLKITKNATNFKKVLGNLFAVMFIASSLGVAASGFVAERSFEAVYIVSLIIALFALIPVFFFAETTKILNPERRQKSIARHFSNTLQVIKHNPIVMYMLALGVGIFVVDNTIYSFLQKYFTDMAVPLYLLGLIFSIDQFCVAAGAKLSSLLDRFNIKNVIIAIPVLMLLSYALLALSNNVASAIFLFFVAFAVSMFYPIQSEIVNSRIPAESRATVLSVKNQLSSLGIMIVFPMVGFMAEKVSLSFALLCLVVAALPVLLYPAIRLRQMDLGKRR